MSRTERANASYCWRGPASAGSAMLSNIRCRWKSASPVPVNCMGPQPYCSRSWSKLGAFCLSAASVFLVMASADVVLLSDLIKGPDVRGLHRSEARRSGVLVPVGIVAGAERRLGREQALAGDEVHFQPDAVGVLEDEEIVARRPVALERPAVDMRAHRAQLAGDLVDILARACAEAEVMQADPVLHERRAGVLAGAALDAERGAAADVIEEVVAVIDLLHAEEGQQLGIKGARLLPVADRQDDVRHTVHFDHAFSLPSPRSGEVARRVGGVMLFVDDSRLMTPPSAARTPPQLRWGGMASIDHPEFMRQRDRHVVV